MKYTDPRGIPVTCSDASAIDGLEQAHEKLLVYKGNAVAAIDKVLDEHPDFIMGHCFKAAALTLTMDTKVNPQTIATVEAVERLQRKANHRERWHIMAVRAWVDGNFYGALRHWEDALTFYPLDLLAMQLAHLTALLLGDVPAQRDVVSRAFAMWDESMPGYEFMLGFYAFGLEENRDFMHAEELARQSLAIRQDNPYAVHTVAHVMEMKGLQRDGISFMARTESNWAPSNFSTHLWWHYTLFNLDLGDVDQVLDVYDNNFRTKEEIVDNYEKQDASAVLWRLKLLDVDVGKRWQELANKWEPSATDTLYALNDMHAMMALVADNRHDAAEQLLSANKRYSNHASDANAAMSRDIGLPFCLGLQRFAEGQYSACVDYLLPVRYMAHRLGGSHAQRDVISWTLLEAAMRAQRFELALSLANERCAAKTTSAQNWKDVSRAFKGLGYLNKAKMAEARCNALLIV